MNKFIIICTLPSGKKLYYGGHEDTNMKLMYEKKDSKLFGTKHEAELFLFGMREANINNPKNLILLNSFGVESYE